MSANQPLPVKKLFPTPKLYPSAVPASLVWLNSTRRCKPASAEKKLRPVASLFVIPLLFTIEIIL